MAGGADDGPRDEAIGPRSLAYRVRVDERSDGILRMHEEPVLTGLVEMSGVQILWFDDFYDTPFRVGDWLA